MTNMTANGFALLRYAMIISVQKLTQVGDKIRYSKIPKNTGSFIKRQTSGKLSDNEW